ncbi:MAG: polyprenol phosphomannose-dependent alpha 1,6 mannosyltransferase MptB, partial [Pseudonocardiaceae bacterium]
MVAGKVRAGGAPPLADHPILNPAPSQLALNPAETRQLDTVRRFGTAGALLMGLGSLGAGTAPVLG